MKVSWPSCRSLKKQPLQQQSDQLSGHQSERAAVYDTQRQQAFYQYQVSIQQLKVQPDEAAAKLADAQAQLGQ